MPTLPVPCLALVTDRRLGPTGSLGERVARALDGGVNLVQLREKDMPSGALLALGRDLREATRGRALLMVNDRADVAAACGADGVQLGEEGLPVAAARAVLGPLRLIGRSVHSVEGAVQAEAEGADLLVLGAVFPSASHPGGAPAGTGLLEQVGRRVGVPLLAIGGVTPENVGPAVAAGAHGVAVISAVLASPDPGSAARALSSAMRLAWGRRRGAGGEG